MAESDEDDEDDYYELRRRQTRRKRLATIWRAVTLTLLGVAIVCFFLQWVHYSVAVPLPLVDSRGGQPVDLGFGNQSGLQARNGKIEFEFASQSGLQVTFALATLRPVLDRWLSAEMKMTEAEWRKSGRNPTNEWLKRSKPYMAPWLLVYPLALGAGVLMTLVSRPDTNSCVGVGSCASVTALLLLVQFGFFGPPALNAFYDELVQSGRPEDALLISLVLDVQYTLWFKLAAFCIVATAVAQIVFATLASRR